MQADVSTFDKTLIDYINNTNYDTLQNLLNSKNYKDSIHNIFKALRFGIKNNGYIFKTISTSKLNNNLIYFILDTIDIDETNTNYNIIVNTTNHYQNIDIFKYLLEKDSSMLNSINITFLYVRIAHGYVNINFIKYILDNYSDNIDFHEDHDEYFYRMIKSKNITKNIVELILPYYSNISIRGIDIKNAYDTNILYTLISYYNIENIEYVINELITYRNDCGYMVDDKYIINMIKYYKNKIFVDDINKMMRMIIYTNRLDLFKYIINNYNIQFDESYLVIENKDNYININIFRILLNIAINNNYNIDENEIYYSLVLTLFNNNKYEDNMEMINLLLSNYPNSNFKKKYNDIIDDLIYLYKKFFNRNSGYYLIKYLLDNYSDIDIRKDNDILYKHICLYNDVKSAKLLCLRFTNYTVNITNDENIFYNLPMRIRTSFISIDEFITKWSIDSIEYIR